LTFASKHAAVLIAALAGAAAAAFSMPAEPQGQTPMPAQSPPSSARAVNQNLVVLDPAHGGPDNGAALGEGAFEKNVDLALAERLKTALTAAGFTVIETRVAETNDPLTTDQRAEIANRAHAIACLVLHATTTGFGLHLYTSTLQPPPAEAGEGIGAPFVPVSWETAQAGFVQQSEDLANRLSSALGNSHLPSLVGRAPVRPLDSLMCPAVAVELAPLPAPGVGATPVTDPSYQQQVAVNLTAALKAWRDSRAQQASTAPGALGGPQ